MIDDTYKMGAWEILELLGWTGDREYGEGGRLVWLDGCCRAWRLADGYR